MKAIAIAILVFGITACSSQPSLTRDVADAASINIKETRTVMGIKFSFTDVAEQQARREGKSLNEAIQSISPFLYVALTAAAKQTSKFEGYVIDGLHTKTGKGMDVARIIIGGESIDLAFPKKTQVPKITEYMKNLGKNPSVRISKSAKRGVSLTM